MQLFPKLLSATGLSLSSLSSHPAHCPCCTAPLGPVGATEACVRQPEEPGRAVLSQPGGNAVKAIRCCKFSAKSVPERSVTVTSVTAHLLDGLTASGFTAATCYPKADHQPDLHSECQDNQEHVTRPHLKKPIITTIIINENKSTSEYSLHSWG